MQHVGAARDVRAGARASGSDAKGTAGPTAKDDLRLIRRYARPLRAKLALASAGVVVETVLEPREQLIITQRYGLDGLPPRAQREVAEACGISRSYVSRLEKQALQKLLSALEGPARQ